MSTKWPGPVCAGLLLATVLAAVLATACGQAQAPSEQPAGVAAPAAAAAPLAPVPTNVSQIFPDAPEKELVMNNCAACHNVACSAIGQRSAARWQDLRQAHSDRVPGVDLEKLFAYLQTHFDDSKPAPNMPPEFLEGGCTPF